MSFQCGIVDLPNIGIAAESDPSRAIQLNTGEGLSHKFLAHIRETDAIVNVVRCLQDDNAIHVVIKVDPIVDIELVSNELCLSDLAAVEKRFTVFCTRFLGSDKCGVQYQPSAICRWLACAGSSRLSFKPMPPSVAGSGRPR